MTDTPFMGAMLTDSGCRFRVWAPNAERVTVMGDFNNWQDAEYPLTAEAGGIWQAEVPGVRAGSQYLYVIDNRGGDAYNPGQHGLRRIDPWARATRESDGNAIVVDVAGELVTSGLQDDTFTTPATSEWLIYQVHIGSFTGAGDAVDTGPTSTGTFAQFQQKLDYIRSLGFNAIALLPIQQNPGDGNEGYGPSHLFAPESSYGSPADLRHLIRAAHDLGLAVLFDVVWNHMSDFDNRLWDFDGMTKDGGIFFEDGERSPWGPRLAFWKSEVRDMIVANARMCFEEYHVDGLRVDAADEILQSVVTDVVQSLRAEPMWHSKLLIAEWTGDEAGQQQVVVELGFDRVWALGDPYVFLAAVDDVQSPDPAPRTHRLEELLRLPHAAARVRYPLGSHDTVHDNESGQRRGFRHFIELVGGRDNWHARAKARMGWALSVTLPGTPMCFMGAECLQPGYWHPRPDENPVHGDHRFNWALCGDDVGAEMRALVLAANRVWWDYPALRTGELVVVHVDPTNGVAAFSRGHTEADAMLVVVNISDRSWPEGGYQLPVAGNQRAWRVVLDTQSAEYGGDGLHHHQLVHNGGALAVTLPRWSVVVLSQ